MNARITVWQALAIVIASAAPLTAGDCGCDRCSSCNANCQATVHHIYRCRHHHCNCAPPPNGMVVQSAPAFAAPLVAAPMYAAPLAAPVQYAAPYAAPAAPAAPTSCNSYGSAAPRAGDDLVLALTKALLGSSAPGGSAAPAAPSVPPDTTLEDRVIRLEERMKRLESVALLLDDRITAQGTKITEQEAKLRKLAP